MTREGNSVVRFSGETFLTKHDINSVLLHVVTGRDGLA